MTESSDYAISNPPYVDAFIASAVDALATMASVESFHRETSADLPTVVRADDVAAYIAVEDQAFSLVSLSFEPSLATGIISRICGVDESTLNDKDVKDGVSEVVNIVVGNTKSRLAGTPYHFVMTLPVPCSGADLYEITAGTKPRLISFEALDGTFTLLIKESQSTAIT